MPAGGAFTPLVAAGLASEGRDEAEVDGDSGGVDAGESDLGDGVDAFVPGAAGF